MENQQPNLYGVPLYDPQTLQAPSQAIFIAGDAAGGMGLLQMSFYHPVIEESLQDALQDLAGQCHATTDGVSRFKQLADYQLEPSREPLM